MEAVSVAFPADRLANVILWGDIAVGQFWVAVRYNVQMLACVVERSSGPAEVHVTKILG